jgi:predicted O-methyltransferase YrrM
MRPAILTPPNLDPTCIFENFRGAYATELLVAAVHHFHFFEILAESPKTFGQLQTELGLEFRPMVVLTAALRAMGLLLLDVNNQLHRSELAKQYLIRGSEFDITDYIGLARDSPGVLQMVELLRTNRPLGSNSNTGVAFIHREGVTSAMDERASARQLTLSLAGRSKVVAPILAERLALQHETLLLDLGGGTGIYSIALLQKHPTLRAILLDLPEVITVAKEFASEYGVSDRLDFIAQDMFNDVAFPTSDIVLLSNVLHDWDIPACEALVKKSAAALSDAGSVIIHDVFLNDTMDGPLPIALYSAHLFTLTEGRAYSGAECHDWLTKACLTASQRIATLVHCGCLRGTKVTN